MLVFLTKYERNRTLLQKFNFLPCVLQYTSLQNIKICRASTKSQARSDKLFFYGEENHEKSGLWWEGSLKAAQGRTRCKSVKISKKLNVWQVLREWGKAFLISKLKWMPPNHFRFLQDGLSFDGTAYWHLELTVHSFCKLYKNLSIDFW